MADKLICISGNIGVGKTSFIELYCQRTGAKPFFETFADNPYLADFYGDMPRWAFASQVFFLTERVRQQREAEAAAGLVVMDRGIDEDAAIFARNLAEQGAFSGRDWHTYQALHALLCASLRPPDLIVYLQASVATLQRRIARRGRVFERGITAAYLTQLDGLYESWAGRMTVSPQGARFLTVPTDGVDFVHNPADFDALCTVVAARL